MSTLQTMHHTYGREARDRSAEARTPGLDGAQAAVECFYYAFNHRSLEVFDTVWSDEEHISLDNPFGGIVRGLNDIRALYRQIFEGPARAWVEFHDVVAYAGERTIVFAGRERGEFTRDGHTVPLTIWTTRVFQCFGPEAGWRQVHHHGSIGDPDALARYQHAVRGG